MEKGLRGKEAGTGGEKTWWRDVKVGLTGVGAVCDFEVKGERGEVDEGDWRLYIMSP